jgi:hypothetical protein
MPSKKTTELGGNGEQVNGHSPSPAPLLALSPSSAQPQLQPVATKKKPKSKVVAPQPPPSPQVLVICRNKCASIPASLPPSCFISPRLGQANQSLLSQPNPLPSSLFRPRPTGDD